MKKIYFILLSLTLSTTMAYAQEQYNIAIDNYLKINDENKNTSFLIVEKQSDNVTVISAEAMGIPLKSENNIQLIISDLISKEISSIEVVDVENKSYYLSSSNKSISSKTKWKEIKFYDNSNKLIGLISFDSFSNPYYLPKT